MIPKKVKLLKTLKAGDQEWSKGAVVGPPVPHDLVTEIKFSDRVEVIEWFTPLSKPVQIRPSRPSTTVSEVSTTQSLENEVKPKPKAKIKPKAKAKPKSKPKAKKAFPRRRAK